ncbi:MAG: YicC/YloC family endoribonuclease [Burkholderiaceae bacterium]|jgi:uncharacterized protein (TIGR00255 family)
MTILSMTGFGSATGETPLGMATVDIRTVNSRFFEFSARMPDDLRGSTEMQLRELAQRCIGRGKIDLRISIARGEQHGALSSINLERIAELSAALRQIQATPQWTTLVQPMPLSDLLRWPGVMAQSQVDPIQVEQAIRTLAEQAFDALQASRAREGERLSQLILDRLSAIDAMAERAHALMPEALQALREKMSQRLHEAFEGLSGPDLQPALEERIRAEAHAASIRSDIAEEIDRLRAHTQEARRTLESAQPVGKRLDFLAQELNREANTLGSKAASLALSQTAMDLKVCIEQIREQVQNLQ